MVILFELVFNKLILGETNSAEAVFLVEYTTDGTLVQEIALPT